MEGVICEKLFYKGQNKNFFPSEKLNLGKKKEKDTDSLIPVLVVLCDKRTINDRKAIFQLINYENIIIFITFTRKKVRIFDLTTM